MLNNNMMMNNMNQNGMNNFGMNPIMNGITMDQTALNIKSIVEPYENKIRELEEIIKQKDFEITVLKQRLKNNNNISNFQVNPMNQINPFNQINPINSMNPIINMNNQMNIINPNMKDKGKEINVKVEKDGQIIDIKVFENDLPSELRKKLGRGSYNYKYKPLISHLSLKDNDITENTIIQFKKSMMNIVFKDDKGKADSLVLSYDCPLGIAICYYLLKYQHPLDLMSVINNENTISFLFNNTSLKIKDKTPIETVFDKTPWPCVDVINK